MANKKKAKKKPTAQAQQQMSPKNYILTGRARKLPIAECWISADWQKAGICSIVVARKHATGNMTFGIYLVDTFCLGLKNSNPVFNKLEYEYEDLLDKIFDPHIAGKEAIDYALAHNIIYGAIAYAEDLGFKPQKDWALSQMILEDDTEDIELIEVEFGKDGKPLFMNGPYDNVQKVLNTLKQSVGEGNYHYLIQIEDPADFGLKADDFELYEDEDDDEFDDDDHTEDTEYEEVKG
jgi:hypothetical protein